MAPTREISVGACSRIISIIFFILYFRRVAAQDSYLASEDAEKLVKRSSTWWFANIPRQGTVPYGNSSWVLFRNVMDFGAIGTVLYVNMAIDFSLTIIRRWSCK
jgi:hypothetical protein